MFEPITVYFTPTIIKTILHEHMISTRTFIFLKATKVIFSFGKNIIIMFCMHKTLINMHFEEPNKTNTYAYDQTKRHKKVKTKSIHLKFSSTPS